MGDIYTPQVSSCMEAQLVVASAARLARKIKASTTANRILWSLLRPVLVVGSSSSIVVAVV